MDKNNPVDYTIISAPVTVNFMCPHCFNDVELPFSDRSEEHTSELQSRFDLVCRLLLEKKKK